MFQEGAYRVRPRIAISIGDPNGIGPEVALKCLTDSRLVNRIQPILIGSLQVLREHMKRLDLSGIQLHAARVSGVTQEAEWSDGKDGIPVLDMEGNPSFEVDFGILSGTAGALAMKAVDCAVDLCLEDRVDAMVTSPISKEAIGLAGYDSPGHTEFIARKCGHRPHTMMMVADKLRIGLVTAHVPLSSVPALVTREAVLEKLQILSTTLESDFGISRPLIAVLGLNPHAGENGLLGSEEADVLIPAIRSACENGIHAAGPFPADGFFGTASYRKYDGVLAMYHDQGLVPFKALAFDSGVNYTAGLGIVRTSPDHGTAFDIAGKGVASPDSMRSAIYLAMDVARRRLARTATEGSRQVPLHANTPSGQNAD